MLVNCTNLIIGGNETTRHAASGGLLALAQRPELWRRLRRIPTAVPTAVEEVLRWTTPGMHVLRTATRDTEIGGVPIRAGERVVVWNAAANRDEDVFADPQRFDIDRSPNRHIAFGQGGHHCLGAALARLELTILFEEMAKQVTNVRLTGADVGALLRTERHPRAPRRTGHLRGEAMDTPSPVTRLSPSTSASSARRSASSPEPMSRPWSPRWTSGRSTAPSWWPGCSPPD
ncbi:cytochrome P450 [Salinispora arenicola]|uniref:cytochrome P450 n=1 Tax=Salinispora arenicola TaxID=168697 RepID=UPI0027DC7295|nr:cytochrome P450 [Salinispora arenicola]